MMRRGWLGCGVVLCWIPVGMLLSAAGCETDYERSQRKTKEFFAMQNSMLWNAEHQQRLRKLEEQAAVREAIFGPPPPDLRTGRNAQELFRVDIPER